jgi:branched-chain amino acid transport system substrate-binding protein
MDDKGDPATALADAQELVQQDKVVAIIGASSGADASWAGYVQQQKVAVITGLPGSADYSTNPSLFLIGTDLQASTWVGVHEAKALGGTKMDLVVCSEVPECKDVAAVTKPLATQQGVKLTLVQAVSATQPDYTAECLAAKQAGATVIDMVTVQATWARFAESCASQNFHPYWILPGNFDPSLTKVAALDGAVNIQVAFPGFVNSPAINSNRSVKRFRSALAKYAPGTTPAQVGEPGDAAWVSAQLFQKVAASLPANPTPANFFTSLYSLKNETLGGLAPQPLNFPTGKPGPPINCAYVVKISNGSAKAPNGLKSTCMPST